MLKPGGGTCSHMMLYLQLLYMFEIFHNQMQVGKKAGREGRTHCGVCSSLDLVSMDASSCMALRKSLPFLVTSQVPLSYRIFKQCLAVLCAFSFSAHPSSVLCS